MLTFSKMHGIGNDYIYINCFKETVTDPEKLSVFLSDVRFGVGSDGLVLILPSEVADFRMRIFNADGSEAMTFFLDESMKWINTRIIINDWVVRFNDMNM